ncbi:MAG: hypothetical protein VX667_07250 [Nitrospinota bacterium]|nr:hypothetical protein [Nitrospinota bacterium]
MFLILCLPIWRSDFEAVEKSPRQYWILFVGIFSSIALMVLLVYSPLRDQMVQVARYDVRVAKEMYGLKDSMVQGVFLTMLPDTLTLIFQSSLKWFLPFLGVGIIWGRTIFKSYRWLPVCVLLFPLVPTLVTGVSGYPRNYLFNLPLLVIFLTGGIFKTGEWFENRIWLRNGTLLSLGLLAVYTLVSFKVLFMEHYPSLETDDGRLYREKLKANSKPQDLILIADSRNYLYSRSTYTHNLKNILLLQQLGGVRAVVPKDRSFQGLSLLVDQGEFFIFQNFFRKHLPQVRDVGDGKKLYTVSDKKSVSALSEDVEAISDWKILDGKGGWEILDQVTAYGGQALFMEAGEHSGLEIEGRVLEEVKIEKPSLVILANVELPVEFGKKLVTVPRLTLTSPEHGLQNDILLMGWVNAGLKVPVEIVSESGKNHAWLGNVFAGLILPGIYSVGLRASVQPGESVLLDGFRLFFVELEGTH